MHVFFQILVGAGTLLICATFHLATIGGMIHHLRTKKSLSRERLFHQRFLTVAGLFLVSLFSHTIQIYLLAFSLWLVGALPGYEEPIYFSLVTYTTLGYGDVTLTPDFRILGAMISVTGILMFGMTTAFLTGLFFRVLGER